LTWNAILVLLTGTANDSWKSESIISR
jgi:hypothetical protein